MKAGRELDALVAEKVMGWSRKECKTPAYIHGIKEMDGVNYYYLGNWRLGWRTADKLDPLYFVEDAL